MFPLLRSACLGEIGVRSFLVFLFPFFSTWHKLYVDYYAVMKFFFGTKVEYLTVALPKKVFSFFLLRYAQSTYMKKGSENHAFLSLREIWQSIRKFNHPNFAGFFIHFFFGLKELFFDGSTFTISPDSEMRYYFTMPNLAHLNNF